MSKWQYMAITTCALNTGKAMHEGVWEQVSSPSSATMDYEPSVTPRSFLTTQLVTQKINEHIHKSCHFIVHFEDLDSFIFWFMRHTIHIHKMIALLLWDYLFAHTHALQSLQSTPYCGMVINIYFVPYHLTSTIIYPHTQTHLYLQITLEAACPWSVFTLLHFRVKHRAWHIALFTSLSSAQAAFCSKQPRLGNILLYHATAN